MPDGSQITSIKQKADDWFFVDVRVFCRNCDEEILFWFDLQNWQNNFVFATLYKTSKSTKNQLSNVDLIEEIMDLSHIILDGKKSKFSIESKYDCSKRKIKWLVTIELKVFCIWKKTSIYFLPKKSHFEINTKLQIMGHKCYLWV